MTLEIAAAVAPGQVSGVDLEERAVAQDLAGKPFPAGKVTLPNPYPMNFEEFLEAIGDHTYGER